MSTTAVKQLYQERKVQFEKGPC